MSKNILINNNLSEIEKLSKAVAEFGKINNLSSEVIYDVRLTLEEVVSNPATLIKIEIPDHWKKLQADNGKSYEDRHNRLLDDEKGAVTA